MRGTFPAVGGHPATRVDEPVRSRQACRRRVAPARRLDSVMLHLSIRCRAPPCDRKVAMLLFVLLFFVVILVVGVVHTIVRRPQTGGQEES